MNRDAGRNRSRSSHVSPLILNRTARDQAGDPWNLALPGVDSPRSVRRSRVEVFHRAKALQCSTRLKSSENLLVPISAQPFEPDSSEEHA